MEEAPGENVYDKVIEVAQQCVVTIEKKDISVCHRLPASGNGTKPIIAKIVPRESKFNIMSNKKVLNDSAQKFTSTMILHHWEQK